MIKEMLRELSRKKQRIGEKCRVVSRRFYFLVGDTGTGVGGQYRSSDSEEGGGFFPVFCFARGTHGSMADFRISFAPAGAATFGL